MTSHILMDDRLFACITCGEPTPDFHEILRKHNGTFRGYVFPCHSRFSVKGSLDGCESILAARLSDDRLWPALQALNDALWLVGTASGTVEVDKTTDELRAELVALAASLEHDERPVGMPTPATDGVVFAPLGMAAYRVFRGTHDRFVEVQQLMRRVMETREAETAARLAHFNSTFSDGTGEAWRASKDARDAAFRELADFCLKEP